MSDQTVNTELRLRGMAPGVLDGLRHLADADRVPASQLAKVAIGEYVRRRIDARASPAAVPPQSRESPAIVPSESRFTPSGGEGGALPEGQNRSYPEEDAGEGHGDVGQGKGASRKKKGKRSSKGERDEEGAPDARASRMTWLTPYLDAWEGRYPGSVPNTGLMVRPLRALEKKHEAGHVVVRWQQYLQNTTHPKPNAAHFAETYSEWDPQGEPRLNSAERVLERSLWPDDD